MGSRAVTRSLMSIYKSSVKDIERQNKHNEKMALYDQIVDYVEAHNDYIRKLTEIHKSISKIPSWYLASDIKQPSEPLKTTDNEDYARKKLENYHPTFTDKLFKKAQKNIIALEKNLNDSIIRDNEEYNKKVDIYNAKVQKINSHLELNSNILRQSPDAYRQVVLEVIDFSQYDTLCKSLDMQFDHSNFMVEIAHSDIDELIPAKEYSALKSVRLSEKPLSSRKRLEMYQAHVMSSSVKVAREIFAYLPINSLVVNSKVRVLDPSTGIFEFKTVLSVLYDKHTFDNVNFENIMLSDFLNKFEFNMNFKVTKGFSAVKDINPPQNRK